MLGKYKIASLLAILTLAFVAVAPAAPSHISKMELTHDGSFTVLTIQGSDQLQYAHQSVEAKEGKPFRIVIDCLASRHGLPQKEYVDLPRSIIKTIRTSQYATTPEEVVRVVLDLNEETVYRVEAKGQTIKVFVSDQKTSAFPQWSSRAVKPRIHAATPKTTIKTEPMVKAEPKVLKPKNPKPSTANKQMAAALNVQTTPKSQVTLKKPSVVKRGQDKETAVARISPNAYQPATPNKNDQYGPVLSTPAKAPITPVVAQNVEKPVVKSLPKTTPTVVAKEVSKDSPKPKANDKPKIVAKQTTPKVKPATTTASTTVKPKSKPVLAKAEVAPPQQKKQNQPVVKPKNLAMDSIERAKVFASVGSGQAKVPDPGVTTDPADSPRKDIHKTSPAKKAEQKVSVTKPKATKPAPVKKNNEVVLASAEKVDQKPAAPSSKKVEEVEKIRTSKYRRDAAKTAEMKATQVVQFPKRMVIKYRRPNPRDPFMSLISLDKKRKGNADLNRIPNIERLNLVGILEPETGKGAALMEDLDGIGYIMRPGDRVKNGYVAQIDDYAIYFQINEYGWGRTVVKHMEKEN